MRSNARLAYQRRLASGLLNPKVRYNMERLFHVTCHQNSAMSILKGLDYYVPMLTCIGEVKLGKGYVSLTFVTRDNSGVIPVIISQLTKRYDIRKDKE